MKCTVAKSLSSEYFDRNATVQGALKALGLSELGATLPGMRTPLLAHQVIGGNVITKDLCIITHIWQCNG